MKVNPLLIAGLVGLAALVIPDLGECVAGGGGRLGHPGGQQEADDCHIQRHVPPARPVGDEDQLLELLMHSGWMLISPEIDIK